MKVKLIILFLLTFFTFIGKSQLPDTNLIKEEYNFLSEIKQRLQPDSSLFQQIDKELVLAKKYPVHYRVKNIQENSKLFIIFIILFAIMAIIRIVLPDYFYDLWNNLFNTDILIDNYLRKGKRLFLLIINAFFDLVFCISLTLLIYYYYHNPIFGTFLRTLLFVILLSLIQILSIYLIYNVFFEKLKFNIHVLNILNYNRFAGIILTLLLFLSFYSSGEYKNIIHYSIQGFIIAIVAIRLLKNFLSIKRIHSVGFLYVLLYLCVFEITLYLVILKQILQV